MSYKPPMGDPAFLQKKLKTASNPNVGKKVSNVEAVVYTGTSSAMMDLVRHNEPSVKQQPGELFRRVRPTTVANLVEQQVMEQRRQQYGEGGFGGGEDRTLEQYRQGIEPLEEHRDLLPARQNNNRHETEYTGVGPNTSTSYSNGPTPRTSRGAGGETVYRYEPGNGDFEIQNFNPSPPRQQQQRAPSSQGLLQGPQGGLVYIDRNASGAQRPPSRTSTAGDPSFYSSAPATSRSVKGVPNNVVTPLAKHEQRDADTVSRYNNTIASSLRPEMSDVASRAGTTQGMGIASLGRGRVQQPISKDIIVQGPIKRPLPKAPGLTNTQQQQLLRAQNSDVGDLTTNDSGEVLEGGELPLSQREMLILDVRDKEDYDKCHIIGAFHFPQIRLAHATNPYSIPEILRFKNKKNHIIVLYDLEEEITVAKKMGNVFFEKGADNVFVMAGGLREFVQTHNHLIVGECPVPIVAKSSRLGAYGADKSTVGSYANRSVAGGVVAGGGGGSRAGTGVGGAVAGRRAVSSTRAGGSTLGGGSRVPQGLSSSLSRR